MKRAAALLLALLPVPAVAADGPGEAIASQFARPALQALATSAERHADSMDALCANPDPARVATAQDGFAAIVIDFGRASVLRFGPLAAESRFERLLFWPDPRGIALRQVQAALAEPDETLANPEMLPGKSAALQGIPALEFVLFGTGSETLATTEGGFRCRYGAALARNIASMSRQAAEGWAPTTPFGQAFTAPDATSPSYRTAQEVNGEVVKALSTALQYVPSAELQPAMGAMPEKANGKRAPLWRSDLTFALAGAQIDGVRALLDASGFAQALPADSAYAVESLRFELNTAFAQLGQIDRPAEEAFGDDKARGHITVALLALHHAGELVGRDLAAGLGLTMGFNALDGD